LPEHLRPDQGDAAAGYVEALAVFGGVDAGDKTVRKPAVAVHDGPREHDAPADIDVGQDHRVFDPGLLARAHVGKQHRALHRRAADHVAPGYQRVHRDATPVLIIEHELGRRSLTRGRRPSHTRAAEIQFWRSWG